MPPKDPAGYMRDYRARKAGADASGVEPGGSGVEVPISPVVSSPVKRTEIERITNGTMTFSGRQ